MHQTQTDSIYEDFQRALRTRIPVERIISDPLRTLAYGTDASFYRLIPRVVIKAHTESEVIAVLETAHRLRLPVTFRAAGTSLCGQAVTDSILLTAGHNWTAAEVLDNGRRIRLQPGVIGARANRCLAPYGKKIGPDPASINAAMIGGIAANNASGMCCGTAQNSYQTVESMRIILGDGAVVDTGDPASCRAFAQSHGHILRDLSQLASAVRADKTLTDRIRRKFKIKNTTGYSLNALVEYEDPLEILVHLMIGSEGTLGFISEITYRTVAEHAHKASALMIFKTIEDACRAVFSLEKAPVQAVELMDRAALRSVENKKGVPDYLKGLPGTAAALLVETRAASDEQLQSNVAAVVRALDGEPLTAGGDGRTFSRTSRSQPVTCDRTLLPVQFTDVAQEYTLLWDIRKGLFPAVGAVRQIGTTVIIEDVVFPLERLAEATLELQRLFARYHYDEAIIFGHALAGNLHFVFTQDFSRPAEVERYRRFMDDVCRMVVDRYDGSLKGEHGTGRNMAPYVEMEWGAEAYGMMKRIKQIFDPENLLNPGVILSDDAETHIRNLKPLPPADAILDKCIECGFCEAICPSKNLSLTPRQRIVIQREIASLKTAGHDSGRLGALQEGYRYLGEQTCAADGLCAVSCPVEINTGEHTKYLRGRRVGRPALQAAADWVADHYRHVVAAARPGLRLAALLHRRIGTEAMYRLCGAARKLSGNRLPAWNAWMPQGVGRPILPSGSAPSGHKVVYYPSCITMAMGPAVGDPDQTPLYRVIERTLQQAGFEVIYPPDTHSHCCGVPFASKGFFNQARRKAEALQRALLVASENGRYPILCDTGPCVLQMRQMIDPKLQMFEPVEFILRYLLDNLRIWPVTGTIAVHITCSSRKMGLESNFRELADLLAASALFPESVGCCGWAGDRGFNFPELTASALSSLRTDLAGRCHTGYSNSRTCEIGLSQHSGIYYKSIFYLLDRCSRPMV
jgi:D-lactate dehydrogenase